MNGATIPAAAVEHQQPGFTSPECVRRTPLYFGEDGARLFGWLHQPAGKPVGAVGMVLCPPIGVDYVNTYPVLRHLADRLARHGIPVLRFDYSGTGNSSGFDADPDRVAHWLRDIHAARAALMRVAGCTDAGLCGVRIGATLAVRVAQEIKLPCLALWGPVGRGRAYMRELRALQRTAEGPAPEGASDRGEIEAGGFVFTAETVQHIAAIDLDQWQPQAARILFAARDDLPGDQLLPATWARDGVAMQHQALPGFAGMLVSPHNSQYAMPTVALDRLEQWIVDAVQTTTSAADVAKNARSVDTIHANSIVVRGRPDATQATVRESVFHFGENGARFAIIAEPAGGARPDAPWAILSNSGALHTAGPNRLYVLLSRALASAGVRCVRFDFPGVGDSVVAPPAVENRSYQPSNSAEIAALINALQRDRGAQRFVLMGLCSGAYASFHGALDLKQLPIVECVLFNPLVFYWKEGMSLDDPLPITDDARERMEHLNLWQYYLGRMRDVRSWKNLLTARSDTRQVVRAMLQRARIALHERVHGILTRDSAAEDPLARDLRALVESGRRVTFMFARSDPGYGLLMTHAGAAARRYLGRNQLHIGFIEHANHTFTNRLSRDEFIRQVVEHLRGRYLAPATLPSAAKG